MSAPIQLPCNTCGDTNHYTTGAGTARCSTCHNQVYFKDVLPTNTERGVGVKHDTSKPQFSLLPMQELVGVVRVLEYGAKKYVRGDWKFVPDGAMRYFDAGMRHLAELTDPTKVEDLRKVDEESGLPAIDHAICSLIMARHFIFKEEKDG